MTVFYFSENEKRISRFFLANPGVPFTANEIADVLYDGRPYPANILRSVGIFMRQFITRSQAQGIAYPERISGVGRGAIATYQLDFTR